MNDIRIVSRGITVSKMGEGPQTEVYLNGERLSGVCAITYEAGVGRLDEVTLRLHIKSFDLEVENGRLDLDLHPMDGGKSIRIEAAKAYTHD